MKNLIKKEIKNYVNQILKENEIYGVCDRFSNDENKKILCKKMDELKLIKDL